MAGRQSGNFPQAFSHVALVNAALNLSVDTKTGHVQTRKTSSSGHPRTDSVVGTGESLHLEMGG